MPDTPARRAGPLAFFLLSIVIGLGSGLGAVLFRGLIAALHNALFLGRLSVGYDANIHTRASPWGAFVILVPVAGAVGVTWLVTRFAPEAKGHGVPEVMDAIYYGKGVIRPIVALIKSLASGLSIGSGGSVGREGPIVQIGSSLGSSLGQLLRLTVSQRVTLIAAGAGGGIAATFNTPVGGVLFATELMLHEISANTLVPVITATATAAYVGQLYFGAEPSFVMPSVVSPVIHIDAPETIPCYALLGILTGLASTLYIRSLYFMEDAFARFPGGPFARHVSGMLLLGLLMEGLMLSLGHYYVEGVGYATVEDILTGRLAALWLMLLLFALKLLATCLTLGSGASGGIFSPSLFMGATLGGAMGLAIQRVWPSVPIEPPAFAVAGMAGMISGSTGAAMTAIVMMLEMTLDYHVVLPMTLAAALSYGTRKLVCRDSIYTLKLSRRGHSVPEALRADVRHLEGRPAQGPPRSTVGLFDD